MVSAANIFRRSIGKLSVPDATLPETALRNALDALADRWVASAVRLQPEPVCDLTSSDEYHADGVAGTLHVCADELRHVLASRHPDSQPGEEPDRWEQQQTDRERAIGTALIALKLHREVILDPVSDSCECGWKGEQFARHLAEQLHAVGALNDSSAHAAIHRIVQLLKAVHACGSRVVPLCDVDDALTGYRVQRHPADIAREVGGRR